MAAWTAASLFPQSLIRDRVSQLTQPMTPAQKLAASGGITRQALANAVIPASTNAGAAVRRDSVVPQTTHPATTSTTPAPTNNSNGNTPSFLNGQNQSANPQSDLLSMLQDLIGGQKQDPDLVHAQTVLAQQQAMQVARDNQAARDRESNLAAQGYLQSQLKSLPGASIFPEQQRLADSYRDRLKVLQSGQDLNWLTMPSSSYTNQPRRGWTGPAMPGTWGL